MFSAVGRRHEGMKEVGLAFASLRFKVVVCGVGTGRMLPATGCAFDEVGDVRINGGAGEERGEGDEAITKRLNPCGRLWWMYG